MKLTNLSILCFAAAVVITALAGCASSIKADVSAFSTMSEGDKSKAVIIVPYEEQKDSLEWRSYAQMMASKLREKGFRVTDDSTEADLIAFLGYAIDNGTEVASTYSIPQWGVTGYSGGSTTGTYSSYGSFGTYSGTTTLNPTYGITGYTTGTSVDTVYTRSMSIHIYDIMTEEKKWEMTLASSGSCGRFSAIAPAFFDAAFRSFPSGGGETVTVPWDGEC